MENPKWTTWVYLFVSAAITYWMITQERAGNNGGDLGLSWAHAIRKIARKLDNKLTIYIDGELDNRRTV